MAHSVDSRTLHLDVRGTNPRRWCFKTWGIFFTPHCLCLSDETMSHWLLLSGVYARRSNRSHAVGDSVTCPVLTNSR